MKLIILPPTSSHLLLIINHFIPQDKLKTPLCLWITSRRKTVDNKGELPYHGNKLVNLKVMKKIQDKGRTLEYLEKCLEQLLNAIAFNENLRKYNKEKNQATKKA